MNVQWRFILPPSSFIFAVLRDGVTGNTSGFELEDEGSTPSPAATFQTRKGTSVSPDQNDNPVLKEVNQT